MMYTPNNISVYLGSFAGCLAGMRAGGKYLTDPILGDYAFYGQMADAFAQAVDTAWGVSPASTLELSSIQAVCAQTWGDRSPLPSNVATNPGAYVQIAAGIVALVREGNAQVSAEGINPSGGPAPLTTVFYIDPRNRTGNASDGNDGASAATPLKTWNGGVLPRLGLFPIQQPSTPLTFNFMSSSPADGSDPITLSPTLNIGPTLVGCAVRFNGTFDSHNIVGSGTLAGVVAKNRATGQALNANLSSVPGAAVGQVLVNTTAGKASRSFLVANLGGGVFELSQPITISDAYPTTPQPAEVNSYANTDTFSLYNEDLIDLVRLSPTSALFNFVLETNGDEFTVVTNLGVLNPGAPTSNNMYIGGDAVVFMYSWIQRRVLVETPVLGKNDIFWGCFGKGGIKSNAPDIQGVSSVVFLEAGAWAATDCAGAFLDSDIILQSGATRLLQGSVIGAALIEGAIQIAGEVVLTDGGVGAALYGGGSLNVTLGRLFLSGTTAVASLLITGAITINSQGTAFTATRANPSVINGAVAITPANIDANASGMFQPGGGAIAAFG